MKKRLIVFFLIIGIGSLVIIGAYFADPYFAEKKQKDTSDAKGTKGTITVGVDSWIGYFPLCGKEMRKRMRGAGYNWKCLDDKADYPGRMKELRKGTLDFAVATVDSFISNGVGEKFPGAIVAVIDESKGGDAIVGRKDKIGSLEALKTLQNFSIAFTPDSPSEHLLRSVAVHFDIPVLQNKVGSWRVTTNGSASALKKLLGGEVDAAVIWEPDVSRALSDKRYVKLLGTDDTHKLIVDILLVGRDFSVEHPEIVQLVLSNYFRALKVYRDHPERLAQEVVEETKMTEAKVELMLKGVQWATLSDNATKWYGIGTGSLLAQEGLIDTIEATIDILVSNGVFSRNPIPDEDSYRLQSRQFIQSLYSHGLSEQFSLVPGSAKAALSANVPSLERKFSSLSAEAWGSLNEIGTLKIRPITFQSGTSELSYEGKLELDKAAANLEHYPNFRVVIKGHTGLRGDKTANVKLSKERADSVSRYLRVTFNIDENRLHEVGFGSEKHLPRRAGESNRSYSYRLPRVELYLVSEEY